MEIFKSFKIQQAYGVEDQIKDYVRDLIVSGRLKSGERLPPTEELAGILGAGSRTVQKALTPLVKEGRLIRRPKHGTFVRERPRALKTIGIYYYGNNLAKPESRFFRALHQCLLDQIKAAGLQWAMWNDHRSPDKAVVPWDELVRAVEHRQLDALIVPSIYGPPHYGWLSKLAIPTAFLAIEEGVPNQVEMIVYDIGRLGVKELARQGCRTVGLITPLHPSIKVPRAGDLLGGFMDTVRAAGLQTAKEWIVTHDDLPPSRTNEQWGYEAFKRIWQQPKHPDGLVVTMDAEGLGVTMAIIEAGLRVPEDLRAVYHKSVEVDVFCPFAVAHVVSSASEMAQALFEMVERQFHGEKVKPIVIPFRLERAGMQTTRGERS